MAQNPNDRTGDVEIIKSDADGIMFRLPPRDPNEPPMIEAHGQLDIGGMYLAYSAAATQFLALLPDDQTAANFEQLYRACLDARGLNNIPTPEGYEWPTAEVLDGVNRTIAGWGLGDIPGMGESDLTAL